MQVLGFQEKKTFISLECFKKIDLKKAFLSMGLVHDHEFATLKLHPKFFLQEKQCLVKEQRMEG